MWLSEWLLLDILIIFILALALEVRYAVIGAQTRGPRDLRLYETSASRTISKWIVVSIRLMRGDRMGRTGISHEIEG